MLSESIVMHCIYVCIIANSIATTVYCVLP